MLESCANIAESTVERCIELLLAQCRTQLQQASIGPKIMPKQDSERIRRLHSSLHILWVWQVVLIASLLKQTDTSLFTRTYPARQRIANRPAR